MTSITKDNFPSVTCSEAIFVYIKAKGKGKDKKSEMLIQIHIDLCISLKGHFMLYTDFPN